jgi:DNA-directed RNA polymerase subunit M/transcription elongation factor TFIIS
MTFRSTKNFVKKQNLHSSTAEFCPGCGSVMSLEPDIKTGYIKICSLCGRIENISGQAILQNHLL